jgi:release factor glutamine methyltransferase
MKRLHHKIDILIFNPPYVVTPIEEVGRKDIVASWLE